MAYGHAYGDCNLLYRLLRDDENPMRDGIMAKYPSRNKEPVYHIRQCSQESKACQWISACASETALMKMIELKKKREEDASIRWVLIDRDKLKEYEEKCKSSLTYNDDLVEVIGGSIVRIVPDREKTGRILDFTDQNVMDNYLPKIAENGKKNTIPINYATKYEEVLIERFIPPHCCIKVMSFDIFRTFANDLGDALLNNGKINEKTIVLKSEFEETCFQTRFCQPPCLNTYSYMLRPPPNYGTYCPPPCLNPYSYMPPPPPNYGTYCPPPCFNTYFCMPLPPPNYGTYYPTP